MSRTEAGTATRDDLARRLSTAVGALPGRPAGPAYVVDLDAFDANAADLARRAAGTPVRTLGRALRTEAALPALVATIGAGVAGSAVAAGFFTLFATEPVVLSYWLLAPVVIGIAVALIASSSSGPMLRRISGERISDE